MPGHLTHAVKAGDRITGRPPYLLPTPNASTSDWSGTHLPVDYWIKDANVQTSCEHG